MLYYDEIETNIGVSSTNLQTDLFRHDITFTGTSYDIRGRLIASSRADNKISLEPVAGQPTYEVATLSHTVSTVYGDFGHIAEVISRKVTTDAPAITIQKYTQNRYDRYARVEHNTIYDTTYGWEFEADGFSAEYDPNGTQNFNLNDTVNPTNLTGFTYLDLTDFSATASNLVYEQTGVANRPVGYIKGFDYSDTSGSFVVTDMYYDTETGLVIGYTWHEKNLWVPNYTVYDMEYNDARELTSYKMDFLDVGNMYTIIISNIVYLDDGSGYTYDYVFDQFPADPTPKVQKTTVYLPGIGTGESSNLPVMAPLPFYQNLYTMSITDIDQFDNLSRVIERTVQKVSSGAIGRITTSNTILTLDGFDRTMTALETTTQIGSEFRIEHVSAQASQFDPNTTFFLTGFSYKNRDGTTGRIAEIVFSESVSDTAHPYGSIIQYDYYDGTATYEIRSIDYNDRGEITHFINSKPGTGEVVSIIYDESGRIYAYDATASADVAVSAVHYSGFGHYSDFLITHSGDGPYLFLDQTSLPGIDGSVSTFNVPNSSFDNVSTGIYVPLEPDNWFHISPTTGHFHEYSSTFTHTGAYSVAMNSTATGVFNFPWSSSSKIGFYQSIPVTPGEGYFFVGYMNSDGNLEGDNKGNLVIEFYDASNTLLSTRSSKDLDKDSPQVWQPFSVYGIAPPGADTARIKVQMTYDHFQKLLNNEFDKEETYGSLKEPKSWNEINTSTSQYSWLDLYSGSYYVTLSSGAGGTITGYYQDISVDVGKEYLFTGNGRIETTFTGGAQAGMDVIFLNGSDVQVGSTFTLASYSSGDSTPTTWTSYTTGSATAPAGAVKARFKMWLLDGTNTAAAGVVNFDDVTAECLDEGIVYADDVSLMQTDAIGQVPLVFYQEPAVTVTYNDYNGGPIEYDKNGNQTKVHTLSRTSSMPSFVSRTYVENGYNILEQKDSLWQEAQSYGVQFFTSFMRQAVYQTADPFKLDGFIYDIIGTDYQSIETISVSDIAYDGASTLFKNIIRGYDYKTTGGTYTVSNIIYYDDPSQAGDITRPYGALSEFNDTKLGVGGASL